MNTQCQQCGGPARVKILAEYRAGVPIMHQFCFQCANRPYQAPVRDERSLGDRFQSASILALGGAALGVYTLLNRYIHAG